MAPPPALELENVAGAEPTASEHVEAAEMARASSGDSSLVASPTTRHVAGVSASDAEDDDGADDAGGAATAQRSGESLAEMTPEVASTVVKQIEFYFSDASLPSDRKLLKHIRKDPEGWVAIKVFANFRKVRAMTRDVAGIARALRTSTTLVVSDDGKQVRRVVPVPEYDVVSIQRRTVVIENLPFGSTIESVTKMMRAYGNINLVRICSKDTKGKLPTWLTTAIGAAGLHGQPSVGAPCSRGGLGTPRASEKPPHAYVEFQTEEEAIMAVAALHDTEGWRPLGVQVSHLVFPCSDTPVPAPAQNVGGAAALGPRSSTLQPRRSREGSPRLASHASERPSAAAWRHGGGGGSLRAGLQPAGSWLASPSGGAKPSLRSCFSHAFHDAAATSAGEVRVGPASSSALPSTAAGHGTAPPPATISTCLSHSTHGLGSRSSTSEVSSPASGSRYVPPGRRGLEGGLASPTSPKSPAGRDAAALTLGSQASGPLRSDSGGGSIMGPAVQRLGSAGPSMLSSSSVNAAEFRPGGPVPALRPIVTRVSPARNACPDAAHAAIDPSSAPAEVGRSAPWQAASGDGGISPVASADVPPPAPAAHHVASPTATPCAPKFLSRGSLLLPAAGLSTAAPPSPAPQPMSAADDATVSFHPLSPSTGFATFSPFLADKPVSELPGPSRLSNGSLPAAAVNKAPPSAAEEGAGQPSPVRPQLQQPATPPRARLRAPIQVLRGAMQALPATAADSSSGNSGGPPALESPRNARRGAGKKAEYAALTATTPEFRSPARLGGEQGSGTNSPRGSRLPSAAPGALSAAVDSSASAGSVPHVIVAHGPDGTKGFHAGGRGRGTPLIKPPA